jgi:ankyrin repeat protein
LPGKYSNRCDTIRNLTAYFFVNFFTNNLSDININAVNEKGETTLMIACQAHDDGAFAQLLIKNGADPLVKNPAGKTALDIAQTYKPASALPGLERLIQNATDKK